MFLQEEVLGELGMTDIPPSIPESTPPVTPVRKSGDRYLIEEQQRSPMFVSQMQAKVLYLIYNRTWLSTYSFL